jgi:hypothetical protein
MSCLYDVMRKSRKEGRSDNNTVNPGVTFYGPAKMRILDNDLNILLEEPWTGDMLRLDYLIDVAEDAQNRVTIGQDVYAFDGLAGQIIDGGYEVQVFPTFALRERNDFVDFGDHDPHDDEDEEELVH